MIPYRTPDAPPTAPDEPMPWWVRALCRIGLHRWEDAGPVFHSPARCYRCPFCGREIER